MMKDVRCPYCTAELNINHDDGYGYDENEIYQQGCGACGRVFTYTTSIIFSYDVATASCLNDESDHDYKPTVTSPVEYTRMICSMCGEERAPTDDEMDLIVTRVKNKNN